MREIADKFTTIIAFWLPGALLLWVLSYPAPTVNGTGPSLVRGQGLRFVGTVR
jgi:hypothetical protein